MRHDRHAPVAERFSADISTDGDGAVVLARGEIDLATAERFEDAVDKALAAANDVGIDLAEKSFMDSTGLAVLVAAGRRVAQRCGTLTVQNASGAVREVLALSGIDALIDVRD